MNITNIRKGKMIAFVASLFLISGLYAQQLQDTLPITLKKVLPITPVQQTGSLTCWAACCQMILAWWTITVSEDQIVEWATGGADKTNFLQGGPDKACDLILKHFGRLDSYVSSGKGTMLEIESNININRPIIAAWASKTGEPGHMLLIIGYDNKTNEVYFIDPKRGAVLKCSIGLFQESDVHKWNGYLRMLTPNNNPGPFDGVCVYTDSAKIIVHQGTASSFDGKFVKASGSNAFVDSWDWTLRFFHSGGEYGAASITGLSGYDYCTWNVSGFTLPSGYLWNYNYNGEVVGDITVSVVDSDGYPHSDTKTVFFTPQNMFPGVVTYASQTVTTSQPDVEAHYRVELLYDQFQPGGDITFRAGQEINIGNGVTFENGTVVDFVIDPSLQY